MFRNSGRIVFQATLVGYFFKARMLTSKNVFWNYCTFQEILKRDVFHPEIKYHSHKKRKDFCFLWLRKYLQSISAISNTRYLDLSLCRTFYLVSSAFLLISLLNPFGISKSAILNVHYVEQFSLSRQSFLDCFPSAISNIRMRFSNESYCSFLTYES